MARRRALLLATAAILAVSVPTLAVEESWNGAPLIDGSSLVWLLPAAIAAAGFLLGGLLAGRWTGERRSGLLCGTLAAAALVGADVFRRLVVVHEALIWPVVARWAAAGVVACLLSACSGIIAGRRERPGGGRAGGHGPAREMAIP